MMKRCLRTLWLFSRPHTVIGSTLAVFAFYLLAYASAHKNDWTTLAITYISGLCLNIYIVGLNQITDIEIDKINKPYLPIPAGLLSLEAARNIVIAAAVVMFLTAAFQGVYLLVPITIVFLIGTFYSLPPFRLKRFPILAAASITLARAVIGNIGLALTYSVALTGKPTLPYYVPLFVIFMLAFMVVIAVMKDVPDIKGDRQYKITTFVSQVGAKKIMLWCRVILSTAYAAAIIIALYGMEGINSPILLAAHAGALIALWLHAGKTDDENHQQAYQHYMFIWKLYYFEFIVFPIACLVS